MKNLIWMLNNDRAGILLQFLSLVRTRWRLELNDNIRVWVWRADGSIDRVETLRGDGWSWFSDKSSRRRWFSVEGSSSAAAAWASLCRDWIISKKVLITFVLKTLTLYSAGIWILDTRNRDTCYSTVTYLLNRPILLNQHKAKSCANSWHNINRYATKCYNYE